MTSSTTLPSVALIEVSAEAVHVHVYMYCGGKALLCTIKVSPPPPLGNFLSFCLSGDSIFIRSEGLVSLAVLDSY